MLPTEKASSLNLTKGNTLSRWNNTIPNEKLSKNQFLYITTNEGIKEGDYILCGLVSPNSSIKIVPKSKDYSLYTNKIIATNDESLEFPLIHDSFLPPFIKSYNDKNQITEVDLEIDLIEYATDYGNEVYDYKINTRKDNTVIIHQSKVYTKEDMKLAFDCGRQYQLTGENNLNEIL